MVSLTDVFAASFAILAAVDACSGPDVNDATLDLIKEFEGFFADIYLDPVGLPTVGYGHLCETDSCGEVDFSFPLSKETATQLLAIDMTSYQDGLTDALSDEVELNANQYGALVSWTYNVGVGAVSSSTLVERLNYGEDPNTVAEEELMEWVYAGGSVLAGLVRRREAEVDLFNNATNIKALPIPC